MEKISIFIPNISGGGAEKVYLDLSHRFIELGFQVDIVVIFDNSDGWLESVPEKANLVNLSCQRIIHSIKPLYQYFKNQQPDFCIAVMWPLTSIAILANALNGSMTKIMTTDHNILSLSKHYQTPVQKLITRILIKISYPFAQQRVAVSNGVGADIVRIGRLKTGSVKTIYNPIKLNELPDHSKVCDKAFICCIGSLKSEKNHLLLLDAFSLVRTQKDVQLIIVGEGELRPQIEAKIQQLHLSHSVTLTGFITNPKAYLEQAECLVLSSDNEGLGNVIIEALSVGTEVVSTDCPSGPREILLGGKYGHLVECNNAEKLAEKLLYILDNPYSHYTKDDLMTRADDFSLERISAQYIELLRG